MNNLIEEVVERCWATWVAMLVGGLLFWAITGTGYNAMPVVLCIMAGYTWGVGEQITKGK